MSIFLDSNGGAPLKPIVAEVLLPFFQTPRFLIPNPSSIHHHGRMAKRWLAEAREQVALSLGPQVDPEQLIFTSSGSEANQLAIRSVFEPKERSERPKEVMPEELLGKLPPGKLLKDGVPKGVVPKDGLNEKKPHWITTAVEHDSNRQMVSWLESQGGEVSILPVDQNGTPRVDQLEGLIRPETRLVSILWVNNETGVVTDIASVASTCRRYDLPLHVDAAQAWGKIKIDLMALGANFVTFSGHKIGGLAGTGVLVLKRGTPARPVILGKQEKGRRGGTENLAGCIALGAAASTLDPEAWDARVRPQRDRLEKWICERIPGTEVNGAGAMRVANTSNLSFEGVEGEGLVMALDLAGYSVSSGSACSSGVLEPSHVLLSMGKTKRQAMAAVRISLADEMVWEELEGFGMALENAVTRVRNAAKCRY